QRLVEDAGADVSDQIELAFKLAFGRSPCDTELTSAENLVNQYGLPIFCRAMFNANEFLYVN
ncbi:MAG: hypothetical protein KC964_07840, partial [Candidatus Omnitrophica bacterium]|nr:hypothetical protein [Candidatus Omnitrophota bacterium]